MDVVGRGSVEGGAWGERVDDGNVAGEESG